MIFDKNGTTTIITQEKLSIVELVKAMNEKYDTFSQDNVIVNLFSLTAITTQDISEFLQLSKKHKNEKHSFVIVTNKISYEEAPEEVTIVPTLQEAYDLIEMEEIERDLGF